MLFMMTSRAHSCGYVAIMVYYCYVVHQSKICNVCLVWNTAHWLEVRPRPLKVGTCIPCCLRLASCLGEALSSRA